MEVTKGRAVDHTGQLELTFFNQSYVRRALHPGQAYVFYGQVTVHGTRRQMTNPLFEPEGKWAQIGGIVPVYPLTAGLSQNFLRTLLRTALPACLNQIEDPLPPALRAEHHLIDAPQAYRSIHLPATWEDLQAARRRLMFEELFCLNLGLTYLRTRRESESALPFPNQDLAVLTDSLPFQLTQAQRRAIDEAAADLRKPTPMSRRSRATSVPARPSSPRPAPSSPTKTAVRLPSWPPPSFWLTSTRPPWKRSCAKPACVSPCSSVP